MSEQFFIAIEGIDGTGKTSHAKHLVEVLNDNSRPAYLTSEPSTGEIGQFLRKVLKDKSIPSYADALLFAADRIDHIHKEILPHLSMGEVVVSDRYILSSICYQSAQGVPVDFIEKINELAIKPNITILLDCPPKIALSRTQLRPGKDKFEHIGFLKKVRANFLSYVDGHNIIAVDASKDIKSVWNDIIAVVRLWPLTRAPPILPNRDD